MSAARVRLVIDRLVPHGVDRGDAAAVRRALSAELEARLAGADVDIGSARDALCVNVAPAIRPAALGRSAAIAIVGALGTHHSPARGRS